MKHLIAIGACYLDTILTVPHYPSEDSKLRATCLSRRRGGNCPNTLQVLQQLLVVTHAVNAHDENNNNNNNNNNDGDGGAVANPSSHPPPSVPSITSTTISTCTILSSPTSFPFHPQPQHDNDMRREKPNPKPFPPLSLHLIAVLPSNSSVATQTVKSSFLFSFSEDREIYVNAKKTQIESEPDSEPAKGNGNENSIIDFETCIYRENETEAASSYIIKAADEGSRTIVNWNGLREMEVEEFERVVVNLMMGGGREKGVEKEEADAEGWWFHFEGRIADTTLECIRSLRRRVGQFSQDTLKISVEVEKPGRPGLEQLAAQSDVVFYSRSWADARGYASAEECLRGEAGRTPKASLLICTWGEQGASALDLQSHRYCHSPAYTAPGQEMRTQIVDAIGAGDTFIAGMLYGLTCRERDWGLEQMLSFANGIAGRKVIQEGFDGLGDAMRNCL